MLSEMTLRLRKSTKICLFVVVDANENRQNESVPLPHAQTQYAAPTGAPPGRSDLLSAPPLPVRRDSEAQPDDIEDVKKVSYIQWTIWRQKLM